jgi:hypothetical protein
LIKLAHNIYTSDARVGFFGVTIQTRMAVVILPGKSLLLYSPVFLTEELSEALDHLGAVKYLVAPNKIHNQALDSYAIRYPRAEIYASPGLKERRPDLEFSGVLTDDPEAGWAGELDQVMTRGNVFFSEVLLYHRSSRTLMVCDLVENMTPETSSSMTLFKLFGVRQRPMASPEFRMYTTSAQEARRSLEIAQSWDFKRIFLCHGDIIERDAKAIFNSVCAEFLAGVSRKSLLSKKLSGLISRLQ